MRTEPDDLDPALLADALERRWGIPGTRLRYLPVGFGSHHWEAAGADGSRWFVSADVTSDDALARQERAFRTAASLRASGLEFVLAPISATGGGVLHRLDGRYVMRLEPFVDGWAGESGDFEHAEDRRRVAGLVGRVHAASGSLPDGLTLREDFALEGRRGLDEALADLCGRWGPGPFAEPAQALLRRHAGDIEGRLSAYDRRTGNLGDDHTSWVVTHGEPHSANVIRQPGGTLRLVDWDTALIAPRERDLWMVLDEQRTGWDEYREAAGSDCLEPDLLDLYRERWALAEIAQYAGEFRRPHADTEDTREAWQELCEYLG